MDPYSINKPAFVSTEEFDRIATEVQPYFLESNDDKSRDDEVNNVGEEGFNRTPPMALVRCSRGGKTRALTEIAKRLRPELTPCVIFVTFNEWSPLRVEEQDNPLLALCRRIAFVASKDFQPKSESWDCFYQGRFNVVPEDIETWLDEKPAVLIVDELNNLRELTKKKSAVAEAFGSFIKRNFLDKKSRYFIFSSHILGALEFFSLYIDPSFGSTRTVLLQEVPIVKNLRVAMRLKSNLRGPREAIYYGLMPSMIHEIAESRSLEGKRAQAVTEYLNTSTETGRIVGFKGMLESLITGEPSSVPKSLHLLLDTHSAWPGFDKKIRWIPYHLEYLMGRLNSISAFPSSMTY